MNKGVLYLFPCTLSGGEPGQVIPVPVLEKLRTVRIFVVEDERSARRFLSAAGLKGNISTLVFYELNEHSCRNVVDEYVKILLDGNDVGIISEAGLPAVADPGAWLVAAAHEHDIDVVPFTGPSSLMLALMASGMNGQNFSFEGYLPVDSGARKAALSALESDSLRNGRTKIFIETPYRNDKLMEDILRVCRADTMICVAADLTLPSQFVKSMSVEKWRGNKFSIGKRPCVFLLQAERRQSRSF
ncbi:MAG: SAM-dependent methyltransferase [Bacteroidales bacterium]|nr:SAM-dependent methyltransferase [Bacteroidales bacterium]